MRYVFMLIFLIPLSAAAQRGVLHGKVLGNEGVVPFATVGLKGMNLGTGADDKGAFELKDIAYGEYTLTVTAVGYVPYSKSIKVNRESTYLTVFLAQDLKTLEEVVVTGTMKEVSKLESPVPVEVFTPTFFAANPTPNLFESIGMINGVRPQINCSVCNTGDIHINGMEGPYTLVLIDGMPIVSSLGTVYGLSGIPNSLVERIEVVKGPASSLYGTEAMAGIINIITKDPAKAASFSTDVFTTSWQEYNADLSAKLRLSERTHLLTGVNYFLYDNPIDNNGDGFTDLTLQNRLSLFNKLSVNRKNSLPFSLATRYVYEDRWGGDIRWNKSWRGSDNVYGESIYTKRWEVISMYQLPVSIPLFFNASFNWHDQNSMYGNVSYQAYQRVAFSQLYWSQTVGNKHDLLAGITYRYGFYDDNTVGTGSAEQNKPQHTYLPGWFLQDEIRFNPIHSLLLGFRHDHDRHHGNIFSPRVAYKWLPSKNQTLRASAGTGFRVVNLFTEDHAALTGSRQVVIEETLDPERSISGNLNYVVRFPREDFYASVDITGFYTYFTNKIVPDYDTDPNVIHYSNLDGHAVTRGVSVNTELVFNVPFKLLAGITLMDVFVSEETGGSEQKQKQFHAPTWSGNFSVNYTFAEPNILVDLTGQWNGPMRLPTVPMDFRPEYSPWHCLMNVQITKKFNSGLEVYGGVKNIFNFLPKHPLLRPHDPFDKLVDDPIDNPHGYTFDTSYNYASMQGVRGFLGVRYNLHR